MTELHRATTATTATAATAATAAAAGFFFWQRQAFDLLHKYFYDIGECGSQTAAPRGLGSCGHGFTHVLLHAPPRPRVHSWRLL